MVYEKMGISSLKCDGSPFLMDDILDSTFLGHLYTPTYGMHSEVRRRIVSAQVVLGRNFVDVCPFRASDRCRLCVVVVLTA